ncbi:MAG: hypothetical protein IJR70_08380 [Eubacterium sp.]|nr:hypothetical protein [Eubacterium sp.]
MANNIKDLMERVKKSDKKLKIIMIAGLIGVLLIMLSDMPIFHSTSQKNDSYDYSYDEYVISLEDKCEKLIESIDGAGECQVMITLKNTKESVYARNSEENQNDSSFSNSYEYVLYKGEDGETPVLIKQYFPQVMGVAVVCSGAGNTAVKENIIRCLSSVFDISSSKISVSKSK